MNVISPETRMMGLPYGEEIMIVGRTMWTQCTSVTDRQTDGRIDGRTELRSQRPCNAKRRTVKIADNFDRATNPHPHPYLTDFEHEIRIRRMRILAGFVTSLALFNAGKPSVDAVALDKYRHAYVKCEI